ncbi:MAG: D-glycerate dehydrogenase [Rhodospirillales bacterium]
MDKPKVVVAAPISPVALSRLEAHCEIRAWQERRPVPRPMLLDWLADADGLLSNGDVSVDAELLRGAPKLRVIAQSAVGYDNVDIAACTAAGVPFGNTPGILVETTADLAWCLLLASARRIREGWEHVKSGCWVNGYDIPFGFDLFGKTLGIVGMGEIGSAVARRARASGMEIVYNNRKPRKDEAQLGASHVSFDALLERADAIVALVPLTGQTRKLFGREQFRRMKRTCHFVNAARGQVVDTEALFEALEQGRIAYAALDTTDPEPLPGDHKLLTLPNILITPHVGSATTETRTAMALLTVENLLAGLQRKPLPACVNQQVNYTRAN